MGDKQRTVFKGSTAAAARPHPKNIPSAEARTYPAVGVTLRAYGAGGGPRRSAVTPEKKPRAGAFRRHFTRRRVALYTALLILIVGGWIGGKFAYNASKLFQGNIFSALTTSKLDGEDRGRVNILLAGNSADNVGHAGGELTDSIMVVSIDTKNKSALMMSIPRDLYVEIANGEYEKINYAYVYGKENNFRRSGYPQGGMGKLAQVVERDFGIDIHYHALVNYNAFRDAVNAVGGIDITVKSSDRRGLFDPNIDYTTRGPLVKLSNGRHHLNGQEALNLARARGDHVRAYGFSQGDFDRTKHQRQMLVALKTKVASAGVLANPAKLTSLSDAIGNNVTTDFEIGEVRRLYDLTKDIDNSKIASVSLNNANGKNLLESYRTSNGQSALIPAAGIDDYTDIRQFMRQQFSTDGVVREGASIVILNGTETKGLASRIRTALTEKNFVVDAIGDALASQSGATASTIIDATGGEKPATLAALKKRYPNATVTTRNPYEGVYTTDLILVLGRDAESFTDAGSSPESGPASEITE